MVVLEEPYASPQLLSCLAASRHAVPCNVFAREVLILQAQAAQAPKAGEARGVA